MQSSARSLTVELIFLGRSLMYSKNIAGPKTVPCGTPEETYTLSEVTPSRTTCCVLLVRKFSIQERSDPVIPLWCNFFSSLWCGTVLKALLKSIMMQSTWPLWSRTSARSSIVVASWVSQDLPFRNPCWLSSRTWLCSQWSITVWQIMCSSNLQATDVSETGR